LPGVSLELAEVLRSGALKFDRRWAICDAAGDVVNGKRFVSIHGIDAAFDLPAMTVALSKRGGEPATFSLDGPIEPLEGWLSAYFGMDVRVLENPRDGYPDDTDSPGPTVISTPTLETVTAWFPDLTLEETRRRFRANLEIGDVEPFWEDRLVGPFDQSIPFRIGSVEFEGVNPCQRCPVPTRDSSTGEATPRFVQQFSAQRQATLPPWAAVDRFTHYYRLAVNTRPSVKHRGGPIVVGDEVVL
jgi:uncharacterized protein YcbX